MRRRIAGGPGEGAPPAATTDGPFQVVACAKSGDRCFATTGEVRADEPATPDLAKAPKRAAPGPAAARDR